MSDTSYRKKNRLSLWLAIGAIFLILLLIVWLTVADITGNTDVAAALQNFEFKSLKV